MLLFALVGPDRQLFLPSSSKTHIQKQSRPLALIISTKSTYLLPSDDNILKQCNLLAAHGSIQKLDNDYDVILMCYKCNII